MSGDNRLEDLLLLWEERFAQGEDVPVEELCKDAPDLVSAVASGIGSLRRLRWLKSVSQPPDPTDRPNTVSIPLPPGSPRLLGERYFLYRRLGEGGFGEVWRGFDLLVERAVAVKVPKKDRLGSAEEVEAFLTEARKAASLEHPGIVPVYDVGHDNGAYYIVSKLVDGFDLERRLRSGPVPVREAVRIVAQVARHLHYAHQRGLVHRDIKPANLLVDEHGVVFVTDFGIAVTADEVRRSGADGLGTLAYMGPERLSGDGSQVDARTDIYSLGVVLYRLLTGRLPFETDSPSDLVIGIVNRQASPPRSSNADVPGAVERVCLKCLEKSPANRPPTAEVVADDLERWLHRTPFRVRASKWVLGVGSACGVLALGLGLTLALDRNGATGHTDSGASPAVPEKVSEQPPEPVPRFREVRRIDAHAGAVLAAAYSADGRLLLSGGADAIRVWDVDTGKQLDPVAVAKPKGEFQGVVFAPDGKSVITFTRRSKDADPSDDTAGLRLWDVETRKQVRHYTRPVLPFSRFAFAPDGRFAWAWGRTEGADGKEKTPPGLGVWDAQRWEQLWAMNGLGKITEEARGFADPSPRRVAFASGGNDLLCTAIDLPHRNHVIRSLDTTTGEVRMRFKGHTEAVLALACLPDGRRFLSGGADRVIRVWDMATGKAVATLEGHTEKVTALAVSPSGRRALSAATDRTARLWSLETMEEAHALTGHKGVVLGLTFSPDGRSAFYGTEDGSLRLLELPPE